MNLEAAKPCPKSMSMNVQRTEPNVLDPKASLPDKFDGTRMHDDWFIN